VNIPLLRGAARVVCPLATPYTCRPCVFAVESITEQIMFRTTRRS